MLTRGRVEAPTDEKRTDSVTEDRGALGRWSETTAAGVSLYGVWVRWNMGVASVWMIVFLWLQGEPGSEAARRGSWILERGPEGGC